MATRIKNLIGALLLWLAQLVLDDLDERVQTLQALNVADIEEDGSVAPKLRKRPCLHRESVKAPAMGSPMNRVCLECKDNFDGSGNDGD